MKKIFKEIFTVVVILSLGVAILILLETPTTSAPAQDISSDKEINPMDRAALGLAPRSETAPATKAPLNPMDRAALEYMAGRSGARDAAVTNKQIQAFRLGNSQSNLQVGNIASDRESTPPASGHEAYIMGKNYLDGKGVEKNFNKAFDSLLKSANFGYAPAQLLLGVIYDYGRGLETNYAEAVKWFRKAADQGNAQAQCYLGVMYEKGQGVELNYAEAVKWSRKAADQGNAQAQYNLGNVYGDGRGVTKDYVEAVKWFRKAADQGLALAQFTLGVIYELGHWVQKDNDEAVKWYQKAALQGDKQAQKCLTRLTAENDTARGYFCIAFRGASKESPVCWICPVISELGEDERNFVSKCFASWFPDTAGNLAAAQVDADGTVKPASKLISLPMTSRFRNAQKSVVARARNVSESLNPLPCFLFLDGSTQSGSIGSTLSMSDEYTWALLRTNGIDWSSTPLAPVAYVPDGNIKFPGRPLTMFFTTGGGVLSHNEMIQMLRRRALNAEAHMEAQFCLKEANSKLTKLQKDWDAIMYTSPEEQRADIAAQAHDARTRAILEGDNPDTAESIARRNAENTNKEEQTSIASNKATILARATAFANEFPDPTVAMIEMKSALEQRRFDDLFHGSFLKYFHWFNDPTTWEKALELVFAGRERDVAKRALSTLKASSPP